MSAIKAGLGFYYGSRLLQPVGEAIGLSLDQVNFVASQLAAILIGVIYSRLFHPSRVPAAVRHILELVLGTGLISFCFGSQVIHLFVQTLICYLLMVLVPRNAHQLCFVASLGYLSTMHIYRQIYDYGGYTLDITGPLMISTQKLSDLAFCINDGMRRDPDKLNPVQREYAIKRVPNLLEMLSYVLAFQNVIIGPAFFFKDYIEYINGDSIGLNQPEYKENGVYLRPSCAVVVLKRLLICVVSMSIVLYLAPVYPATVFRDAEFLGSGFFYKMFYMLLSISLVRAQYYFAWTLAEVVNIVSGFGFKGFKDDGSADWSLVRNIDVWNIEFCTSIKINMDSWNISTLQWLRRTVYERVPFYPTLLTFATSAFWHGFYPGYYIAFTTAAGFLTANRKIRRNIRPHFQSSKALAFLYDCVTFVGTRLCNVYMALPFLIYELVPTLEMYWSVYCWLHIATLAFVLILPEGKSQRPKTSE